MFSADNARREFLLSYYDRGVFVPRRDEEPDFDELFSYEEYGDEDNLSDIEWRIISRLRDERTALGNFHFFNKEMS
jgi:hypothetical protein